MEKQINKQKWVSGEKEESREPRDQWDADTELQRIEAFQWQHSGFQAYNKSIVTTGRPSRHIYTMGWLCGQRLLLRHRGNLSLIPGTREPTLQSCALTLSTCAVAQKPTNPHWATTPINEKWKCLPERSWELTGDVFTDQKSLTNAWYSSKTFSYSWHITKVNSHFSS